MNKIHLGETAYHTNMIITFKNKRVVSYIGRNGFGKQIGLEVLGMSNTKEAKVSLSPVNSKGDIANCIIDIPVADIPAVIKALRMTQKTMQHGY